ncbi:transmembrane protein 104-like isoform X2 [Acanthaster planci]|uniref:Transmembrane protein 104-like isoform X2 n=1 Tax=Acanthaster planci TaxID=133434 RepID=A0A8B7YW67_ACAPL|nr:transmembrane protein 104-like isoform X2 [Acanthaster planci]
MASSGLTETGELYSPVFGMIYVFNLIVGTGALTMPLAFARAGWAMGGALIAILAFASFLTVTFVVEAMASANAVMRFKRKEKQRELEDSSSSSQDTVESPYLHEVESDEKKSLLHPPVAACRNKKHQDYFEITERVEMAKMASLFFNKIGVNLFYLCMAIYLYGDLAIYAVTVPTSLRNITCTYKPENSSAHDDDPCWDGADITRINVYRIYLSLFSVALGIFAFFNVQKTKYLQLLTTFLRWLAFSMMIVLALIVLGNGKGEGDPIAVGAFESIPNFFGVCVYSFMCHHSLPSMVTPIKRKNRLSALLAGDYALILGFYLLLSLTAIFTFSTRSIQEIYTLNFFGSGSVATQVVPVQYFIGLFPVFTLSTNFPIIAITLRNNLKMLFAREGRPYPWAVDRIVFPLLALLPGIIVAFITTNVTELVGYTGSYAGAGIQYVIPAFLVYCGRKKTEKLFGQNWNNKHRSPFKHKAWVVIVLLWAVLCIGFVTANHIITATHHE